MSAAPELSLVLACYNEAGHLVESVREIDATLTAAGYDYELILIDDRSADETPRIVTELCAADPRRRCVLHEQNVGRGGTVAEGFRLARGRIVGFLDVDLEVHCRHVPRMVDAIRAGRDGATAYRDYAGDWSPSSIVRLVLSRGYRLLFRLLLAAPFRDTEAGYKFFVRSRILPVLERTTNRGWFWDTEIMVLAHRAGLDVVELRCPFVRRADKASTVRLFRDSWDYLVALLRFRRRLGGA